MRYKSKKENNFSEIIEHLEEIYSRKKCVSQNTFVTITDAVNTSILIQSQGLEAEIISDSFECKIKGALSEEDKKAVEYLKTKYPAPVDFLSKILGAVTPGPNKKYWHVHAQNAI